MRCHPARLVRAPMLVVLALLLAPAVARGRTLAEIDEPLAPPWKESALRLLRRHAAALGSPSPRLELASLRALPGGAVIRARQLLSELPVVGAEAVVHVRGDRAVALSGRLHDLSGVEPIERARLLDRAAAAQALQRARPGSRLLGATLAFWPGPPRAQPVWRLRVLGPGPLELFEVFLSAWTGERIWQRPALREALGRVYEVSPALGALAEKPLLGLSSKEQLQGEHVAVQSCQLSVDGLSCQSRAKPDASGDYLFKPDEPSYEDAFAEVQAYFHVDTMHRWMAERFGWARKSGKPIQVRVNLGVLGKTGQLSGVPNAFYGDLDENEEGDLNFGQSARDYAYDGDVVDHEFTHSVVGETSQLDADLDSLGLNMMPLGLNEGFADAMACSHSDDAVVGEYVSGSSGGLRDLRGTGSCPDQMIGEPHVDGLVWGRALWAIREQAPSKPLFETLIYQVMTGLPASAGFSDAAALLLKLTQVSAPTLHPVASAELAARGLLACSRLVPLLPGKVQKGQMPGAATLGLKLVPAPFQYRIEVPAGATELRVNIKRQGSGAVAAYYRRGEPVSFQGTQVLKDGEKPSSAADLLLSVAEGTLLPGGTYYVIPVNPGNGFNYAIQASLTEKPPSPDAAPLDAGPPDGSAAAPDAGSSADAAPGLPAAGGCSMAGSLPASALLPLLILLGAALRRRR